MTESGWTQVLNFNEINSYQRKHNLNDTKFCGKAGVSLRLFQDVRAGKRRATDNFIGLIADAVGVQHPSQIAKWIRK